jgi:dephospho-CoA kinase
LEAARQQRRPAAVLDAALMIEAGWDQLCDHLVFVEASREQRLQRALERGWTESEFQRREATQLPLDVKRARADSIIDNSGTLRETLQQAAAVWELVVGPLSGA